VGPTRFQDNGAADLPRTLGRYRLVREQGTGLFGTVWLAEDTRSGVGIAIRVLPRELTEIGNVAETIRRRARAVVESSYAHPGLVRVLEYGTTDDGRIYAVMERAEGRRLDEVLAERIRSDVPAALRLAVEMGGPVEMLHNMGMLHGGLRPRNFAIADGRVTLMDIETIALRDAPALQHLVAEQSRAEYLSPEQLRGGPITEKTDVYGFATTVYEMLAGHPPFQGPTREVVIDKQLTAVPPPVRRSRRTVPASIETTLLEALNKRPEQRPFMPKLLNHLANEAGIGDGRWKRVSAIAAGFLVASALAVPVSRMFLGPPAELAAPSTAASVSEPATGVPPGPAAAAATPQEPRELPPPLPPAVATPMPDSAPPVETPAVAVVGPATEMSPPPIAPVDPPWRELTPSVPLPPVPPPAAALRPAAPPAVTPQPAPTVARRPAPLPAVRVPTPTESASPVRAEQPRRGTVAPAAEPDPNAVIDWLLSRRNN
jgi:serine/threonine protein kinase